MTSYSIVLTPRTDIWIDSGSVLSGKKGKIFFLKSTFFILIVF